MVAFTLPSILLAVGTVLLSARGAPTSFQTTNALAAQKLNAQFASLSLNDTCADGAQACVQGAFSSCIGGKWLAQQCAGGTTCVVLPLVNKEGTAIACDTQDDAILRMTQAGVDASLFGNNTVVASSGTPTATQASPSTTISDPTSASTSTASVDPTSDPEDDPECTMDMSTSVAQATFAPTASSSSAYTTTSSAATAVVSPTSTDDGDSEDCTMVENVELAMAPTTSPSATASISGFTRQRFVATGAAASVSDSLTSSLASAAPSTSPNSASSTSAPVSVAPSSATLSEVQVVTVQTTVVVTVTVQPSGSAATVAASSGSSSIVASASPVSTFAGASASNVAGSSLGAASASTSAILASSTVVPTTSTQSANTATSAASSPDLFPIPLSDITIVGTLTAAVSSAPTDSPAITSSLASATSAASSTSASATTTPAPTDQLSIDASDIAYLLTATVSSP